MSEFSALILSTKDYCNHDVYSDKWCKESIKEKIINADNVIFVDNDEDAIAELNALYPVEIGTLVNSYSIGSGFSITKYPIIGKDTTFKEIELLLQKYDKALIYSYESPISSNMTIHAEESGIIHSRIKYYFCEVTINKKKAKSIISKRKRTKENKLKSGTLDIELINNLIYFLSNYIENAINGPMYFNISINTSNTRSRENAIVILSKLIKFIDMHMRKHNFIYRKVAYFKTYLIEARPYVSGMLNSSNEDLFIIGKWFRKEYRAYRKSLKDTEKE